MTPREALLHGIPYHSSGGNGVYAGAFAGIFVLQMPSSARDASARAWPPVVALMYPSRTRDWLSNRKTDDTRAGLVSECVKRLLVVLGSKT